MIVVQGNIPLKAEARDRAIKLAMEIEGISKQEVGCLGYQFYVALTDPLELVLFQQWESVDPSETLSDRSYESIYEGTP